jgi:hypothetical protein
MENLNVQNMEPLIYVLQIYTLHPFTLLYSLLSGLHRGSTSTKLRVMSLVSQGYTGVGLVPEQFIVTHEKN